MAAVIFAVARKYKTLLNPVSFFGAFFFAASVLSPLLSAELGLFVVPKRAVDQATFLSALYFAVFGVAYLVRTSPFRSLLEGLVKLGRPFVIVNRSEITVLGTGFLATQFVILYMILMSASGAGLMWLTDPRQAYQLYRSGVGFWWSLSEATLMLLFLIMLFRKENTPRKIVFLTVLFSGLAFFLGSKSHILAYPVVSAFYFNFWVRRVRTAALAVGSVILLSMVIALQLVQKTADTLFDALRYFDYFNYSAAFLDKFRHSHFRHGAIMMSDSWYYVPRFLYPDKPFVYGQNLLIGFLNPGFESTVHRTGFTPGMLQWSVGYADFGIAGVVAVALATAWVSKAAFEYFLESRSFVSLALLIQIGFVYHLDLFPSAPFPVFWVWLLGQGFFFWLFRSLVPYASSAGGPGSNFEVSS